MFEKIKSFLFKNTSDKQTVAKNTVWLSISNFGGRFLKAIVIIYSARVLGTAGYGVFSYALTLAGFFTFFMDPGINAILMRDVSKASEEERRSIFSTAFVLKLCLLAVGIFVVLAIAPYFSTLPGAKALLPIVALVITGDTLREFFSSLVRAREKMEWETGIFLLTNATIVTFGFFFLFLSPTPKSLGWGYAMGTLIGGAAAMVVVWPYLKDLFSHFSSRLIAPILRSAWPFAIVGALGGLLTSADILIVSWFRTASEVGVYSAAIRIIQVLYLVPMVFQYSTLPILARLANKDNARFRAVFERTVSVICLVSIPLALGGLVVGTQFMRLVFGAAYAAGGMPFKVLALGLLFDYPTAIISSAVFAYNHQKSLIVCSAIGGIANVAFDLLLIPRFGITGSAVATLIAQFASNWYLWNTMKKLNHFNVFPFLVKITVAGITMALATTLFFFLGVNVIVNILLSGILYGLLLWLFREPLLREIKYVFAFSGGKP
jgi:O-antigen/teichoic acid export membrane protein